MKREPTAEEYENIARAVFADDRIEATNLYISIAECGLTEAQNFIKEFTAELQASQPDKFARKKRLKRFMFF